MTGFTTSRSATSPVASPTMSRAPADAASSTARRTSGRLEVAASTSRQSWLFAPPPAITSSVASGAIISKHRATSYATDSMIARVSSPGPLAAVRPANTACASGCHHGARAPCSQGSASTPFAPGGVAAASVSRTSVGRPVIRSSHSMAAPAVESPASMRNPSSRPRETTAPVGRAPIGPPWGTETFVVVPQETIGAAGPAPVPSTSHARSPPPITMTTSERSPRSSGPKIVACDARRYHRRRSEDGRKLGRDRLRHPELPVEPVEPGARRERLVGDDLAGQARDDEVPRREHPTCRGERLGLVIGDPRDLGCTTSRVEHDAGPGPKLVRVAEVQHRGGAALVRPENPGSDRAQLRIETGERRPRGGEAECRDGSVGVGRVLAELRARVDDGEPPVLGILLRPPRSRVRGRDLAASDRDESGVVPQGGFGRARPEVERETVTAQPASGSPWPSPRSLPGRIRPRSSRRGSAGRCPR